MARYFRCTTRLFSQTVNNTTTTTTATTTTTFNNNSNTNNNNNNTTTSAKKPFALDSFFASAYTSIANVLSMKEMQPEHNWKDVEFQGGEESYPQFLYPTEDRMAYKYYTVDTDDGCKMVGKVRFGNHCEGPSGHCHGGAMAAFLDQLMGYTAVHLNKAPFVVARLEITMRKPIPLLTIAQFSSHVTRVEGRKVWVKSELFRIKDGGEKEMYCEGEALTVKLLNPLTRQAKL